MERLTEEMLACLERLRSHGFVPPLTFTCIGANRVVFTGHYTGEWDALQVDTVLHAEASLYLPLYFLFVDDRGEAAGCIVAIDDTYFVQWPSVPRTVKGH